MAAPRDDPDASGLPRTPDLWHPTARGRIGSVLGRRLSFASPGSLELAAEAVGAVVQVSLDEAEAWFDAVHANFGESLACVFELCAGNDAADVLHRGPRLVARAQAGPRDRGAAVAGRPAAASAGVTSVVIRPRPGSAPDEAGDAMRAWLDLGLDVRVVLDPTVLGHEVLEDVRATGHGHSPTNGGAKGDVAWSYEQGVALLMDVLDHREVAPGRPSVGVEIETEARGFPGAVREDLAFGLVHLLRQTFGGNLPVSLAGGLSPGAFPDALAVGLGPIFLILDEDREPFVLAAARACEAAGVTSKEDLIHARSGGCADRAMSLVGNAAMASSRDRRR